MTTPEAAATNARDAMRAARTDRTALNAAREQILADWRTEHGIDGVLTPDDLAAIRALPEWRAGE